MLGAKKEGPDNRSGLFTRATPENQCINNDTNIPDPGHFDSHQCW